MVLRGGIFAICTTAVLISTATSVYASVLVSIEKSTQQMTVSVDGEERYTWPVSTGRAGYATPSGTYTRPTSLSSIIRRNGTMRRCPTRSSSPQRPCHPWLLRDQAPRLAGLARLRAPRARQCGQVIRARKGEGGERHNDRAHRGSASLDCAPSGAAASCSPVQACTATSVSVRRAVELSVPSKALPTIRTAAPA
jgi:hypothetical protein